MTKPSVELVRTDDPAWGEQLDHVTDDVYHRVGYHKWQEESGADVAFLAVISDQRRACGLIWPYLLRPVATIAELSDAQSFDVSSVYGYPGPLAWGCRPGDTFVREAELILVDVWRSQGAVAAFTRFHPILENVTWAGAMPVPGPNGMDPIALAGETVSIDLRQDDASAVAGYGRTLRQEIARARAAGLTTRLDETWSALDVFSELYRSTMVRSGAHPTYFFSTDDFRRLKKTVGDELHLFVTESDGRPAAAGLFTEHAGIVQAHLVGTNEEFREWSPLKVLLDDVRRWSAHRGNGVLHLGGGRGARDDSLLAFKARFSPRRHQFWVGRWVIDSAAYETLTVTRRARAAVDGRAVGDQGWFPPYRAPLVAVAGPEES